MSPAEGVTCPTCRDRGWTTGPPDPTLVGLTGIADDTGVRDWLIPCPCSPARSPSELARLAKHRMVGWSLTAVYVDGDCVYVPWPFLRKGDERDDVSAWLDHEPDVGENIWLNIMDIRDLDS